jgi:hypothetical protein
MHIEHAVESPITLDFFNPDLVDINQASLYDSAWSTRSPKRAWLINNLLFFIRVSLLNLIVLGKREEPRNTQLPVNLLPEQASRYSTLNL